LFRLTRDIDANRKSRHPEAAKRLREVIATVKNDSALTRQRVLSLVNPVGREWVA
jgi:hypothetical protein